VTPVGSRGLSQRAAHEMVVAVLWRPDLWWSAIGALRRLAVPGWWRSRPHLPLPDERLWAFRMVTAYGSPDADPVAADVISYLEWCRSTAVRCRPTQRWGATDSLPSRLDATRSG
jgi:hypothetical protein